MPRDAWNKKLPSGEMVHFTYLFEPRTGGVITAKKGDVSHAKNISAPMTREQIEAEFRDI